MTLEQQVCSLDLAKRLKELGVKQESVFRWSDNSGNTPWQVECWLEVGYPANGYSAFTVAELGEMLPPTIVQDEDIFLLNIGKGKLGYFCFYGKREPGEMKYDQTEADARAKMLIYLLENGLVKAEDIK